MGVEQEPMGEGEEANLPGPGAPTPLSALEVRDYYYAFWRVCVCFRRTWLACS